MAGASASKASAPPCRGAGAGEEPVSLQSSARSHHRQRPGAGASAEHPAFSFPTHCLHPAAGQHPERRRRGPAVPRGAGQGLRGSRAEPPAPSDGDGTEHRGPAHVGSRLRLRHFCHKTGLNGGWKSSFLQYLNPASLPARLCPASAFSWSGLSSRREEAREAPGAGGRPPPAPQESISLPLVF